MTTNGSQRWFQYEDGRGLTYAVRLDESTYENAAFGFTGVQAGVDGPVANGRVIAATGSLPLRLRYVNLARVDSNNYTLRRTAYCGSPTAPVFTGATSTVEIDGDTWFVSSTRGEQLAGVSFTDTEQLDGDLDAPAP